MVIVRIDNIKEVTATSTGKRIARIEVTELSLNKVYPITVWLNDKNFEFNVGEQVEMVIKTSEYQGKSQYSTGIESIKRIVGAPIPKTFPTPTTQPVKRDEGAQKGATYTLGHAMTSPELCNQLFTGQGACPEDIREKLWDFYVFWTERCRKYE